MKKIAFLLLAAVTIAPFLSPLPASHAAGCARPGDSMGMVVRNCGEPTYVDTREEWRNRAVPSGVLLDGWYVSRYPRVVQVLVQVEDWTYDFGRTKFTRILTFEDGILVAINTGGYGGR